MSVWRPKIPEPRIAVSSYVVLNFEDKIGSTAKGADSPILALTHRYETRKQRSGLGRMFLGKHKVNEHRCVQELPMVGFTTDATTLQTIRQACASAEKVYLVLHGDPRTTDTAYTNAIGKVGVVNLCSSAQLAAFLSGVLPRKDHQKIALVMCYGARCKDYRSANVNHQGAMGINDLKTSFAYRLVYELVQLGFNPLVSAVTGKIQHNAQTGHALIEREELIDINMELAEASRTFTQDAKLHGGGGEFKKTDEGKRQFDGIKDIQAQLQQARTHLPQGDESNKYGKLVFKYKNATLKIVNKYGGQGANAVTAGTVLYSGALVTPGAA